MIAKLRPFGRIKPKYNPVPNAKERRHHERLISMPCIACKGSGGVAHHVLTAHFEKRWRRDHEWVLPMCDSCHRALHSHGDEQRWCNALGFDPIHEAEILRHESINAGVL